MRNRFTEIEITKIIAELDRLGLPFEKYSFSMEEDKPVCLGSGGSGYVFAAKKGKRNNRYAIKVLGLKSEFKNYQSIKRTIEYQESAAGIERYTVKVFDHNCVRIKLNDDLEIINAEKVLDEDVLTEDVQNENEIFLYFMLIERLTPVIKHISGGEAVLEVKKLKRKKEIYKLAFEIGKALENLHLKGIMHRDVKLENIFYSKRERKYKLGDFDMSEEIEGVEDKRTVFTNGYGAPEAVDSRIGEYDATADIYSFGITLYLLINKLCFPGSDRYRVNIAGQYNEDFELARPERSDSRFYRMIKKMCRFKQEDRYQTMSDVVGEIEGVRFGQNIKSRRKERKGSFVMGMFLAMIGGMILPSAFTVPQISGGGWPWAIVMIFSIIKVVLDVFDKKKASRIMMIPLAVMAVVSIVVGGFSWWKLVSLVFIVSINSFGGILTMAYLGMAMSLMTGVYSSETQGAGKYEWLPIMLFALGVTFAMQYLCLSFRNETVNRIYHSRNILLKSGVVLFGLMIIIGIALNKDTSALSRLIIEHGSETLFATLQNCRIWLAGLVGGAVHMVFAFRFNVLAMSEFEI